MSNGSSSIDNNNISLPLVPIQETNVDKFIQQTKYNGENVIIGILDTGIDPATNRFMDDGITRKLINAIDCTGSGDVDITEQVHATKKVQNNGNNDDWYWTVTGLTGRTLKLSKEWNIQPFPTNDTTETTTTTTTTTTKIESSDTADETNTVPVRIGIKCAYELFPRPLITRIKQERKKQLEENMASHIVNVQTDLANWKLKNNGSSNNNNGNNNNSNNGATEKPSAESIKERDNLQALVDILTTDVDDPGPVYDCIVFYDGEHYRAVIDVNETGDVRNQKPMASYDIEYEYNTFSVIDQMNYAIQFYNNYNILCIVCDTTPHGTHVGSITSHIAPNAKLISYKIGDPRLDGMETCTALVRALKDAVKMKCDVINLSYGEAIKIANSGHFINMIEEFVWKYNIIFVAAAGNQGPALSTVDAPGGTTTACISVAAHVSNAMRDPLYSIIPDNNKEIETTFTWSSTGPTTDGDIGVNVSAPGGAITTVSNWCLQKSRLMNGTSMASPHVTGCIALLLSACKANNILISPARIRRAIEQTATFNSNMSCLQQGWGLVQVDKAWEYILMNKDIDTEDIFFDIEVLTIGSGSRGIYLRQFDETTAIRTFVVQVIPQFRREDVVSDEIQKKKIALEIHCTLEATESWVTVAKNFVLLNEGRTFDIEIDPTNLQPGLLYTAKVNGIETNKPERKVIFSVPITVIKPLPMERILKLGELDFDTAERKRYFVVPPHGSTWMDITLHDLREPTTTDDVSNRIIALHTVQLLPHSAFRDNEYSKRMVIIPGQTIVFSIAVIECCTAEVTIARFWSTRGSTQLDATIQFRGVRPEPKKINIIAGSGGTMVHVESLLDNETINPSASLTKWQCPIRPKPGGIITPLGARDSWPNTDKKTYQLILTYEFEQDEKGSFIPRAPALQDVLYESAFESQRMLIFDGDKKYLGMSDAYPSTITAPKGTVVIRLELRHIDPTKLEPLKDLIIWIERNLSKEISIPAYKTMEDVMMSNSSGAYKKRILRKGHNTAIFFAEPSSTKIPSTCSFGCRLVGTASYEAADSTLPGEGKKPGGYPICYYVGPKASKDNPVEAEPPEPTKKATTEEKLEDAVRDLKIEYLGKLTSEEKEDGKFEEMYSNLEKEYPTHLPLKMAKLKYLDNHEKRTELLNDIVSAAEAILSNISEDELALNLGRKVDSDDGDALKERDEVKEKKSILVETLVRLAHAYIDMKTDEASNKFDETLQKLKAWADIESYTKYATLYIEREMRAGRYGVALKQINKMLITKEIKKEKDMIKPLSRSDLYEKRVSIYEKLGYTCLVNIDKIQRKVACPNKYIEF